MQTHIEIYLAILYYREPHTIMLGWLVRVVGGDGLFVEYQLVS